MFKKNLRNVRTLGGLLSIERKMEGERCFSSLRHTCSLASNGARVSLCCSILLRLSFLPLKILLYQKMRQTLPQEARKVKSDYCKSFHDWVSREGSWRSLPVSPERKELPRKKRSKLEQLSVVPVPLQGQVRLSAWKVLMTWTRKGSNSLIDSFTTPTSQSEARALWGN